MGSNKIILIPETEAGCFFPRFVWGVAVSDFKTPCHRRLIMETDLQKIIHHISWNISEDVHNQRSMWMQGMCGSHCWHDNTWFKGSSISASSPHLSPAQLHPLPHSNRLVTVNITSWIQKANGSLIFTATYSFHFMPHLNQTNEMRHSGNKWREKTVAHMTWERQRMGDKYRRTTKEGEIKGAGRRNEWWDGWKELPFSHKGTFPHFSTTERKWLTLQSRPCHSHWSPPSHCLCECLSVCQCMCI